MKIGISISTALLAVSTIAYGQAEPAGVSSVTPATSAGTDTTFNLPGADGTLHYALGASEVVQYYSRQGTVTPRGGVTGDVSYSSTSETLPFSMLLAAGILFPESSSANLNTYLDLNVSQSLVAKRWVLGISDSLSYLPQSATGGLSGIPGVGDIGTIGPTGNTGGILTNTGGRIGNSVTGSVERLFTGRTSISGSGFYSLLHFVNASEGFDTTQVGGQVALNHRLDARDTVSANAVYSVYNYGKTLNGISFTSRGINGVYSRVVSRSVSAHVSIGPQWISSSDSALIPNRLDVAANAGLTYEYKRTSMGLDYSRGVSGGSGVQLGGLRDSVAVTADHAITPEWLLSANADYTHTSGLANPQVAQSSNLTIPLGGNFSTFYGGVQLTHRFRRTLSGYASYTVQHQTSDLNYTGTTAFSGTSHIFGFGITYTPRATRLGQF
jgi:hypothetical protein